MVKLKEIPRTATFAWAPTSVDPLIVSGTVAGAIDEDFSSTTQLELWDLNLIDRTSDGFELTPKASIDTDARFYDIAWGAVSDSNQKGLIAGALESGSLQLWNPEDILAGKSNPVEKSTKHSGAIKSLQFNPKQNKLLASGGARGEIYVWDLNKFDAPSSPGVKSSKHDEIDAVAWNRSVYQILATGGNTGFTSIWDLRKKREVLHLHYNSGSREQHAVSSVVWHPTNSTRLITASEDDSCPVVLSWDLRNANAPQAVLQGHDKGVLSLDWCTHDSELLISSGKDNRTLLWNPETKVCIGEYPIATNWSFETRFNPLMPDVFASASFDGKITVQTLQDVASKDSSGSTAAANSQADSANFWDDDNAHVDSVHPTFNVQQAPSWLKRPSSATFGFGGKIVSVKTVEGKSAVSITKFAGEGSLSEETAKFGAVLDSGNYAKVVEYRKDAATTKDEKYDWNLLEALTNADKDGLTERLKAIIGLASKKAETPEGGDKDVDESAEDDFSKAVSSNIEEYTPSGEFKLFDSSNKAAKQISEAVLKGDLAKAVDICLENDLQSDAFMLSLSADATVRKKVQAEYTKKFANEKPYLRVLAAISKQNLDDLVENSNISEWKDVLGGLFVHCKDKQTFNKLVSKLGDRILGADDKKRNDALFCYVSGANLSKASGIWLSEIAVAEKSILKDSDDSANTPYAAHVKALHRFIEKVTVFSQASGSLSSDAADDEKSELEPLFDAYRDYANIVASQGDLDLAKKFLDLLPAQYPGVSLEKERVNKAAVKTSANNNKAPAATKARGYAPATSQYNNQYSASPYGANQTATSPVKHTREPSGSLYGAAQQPAPSIYAPAQPTQTGQASQASQPAQSPYGYTNPYAASNPYRPQSPQKPVTQAPLAPPPKAGSGTSTPPPPKSKTPSGSSTSGWNDLPVSALAAAAPKRPTSTTTTIVSPFPGQTPAGPSPSASTSNMFAQPPPPPPPTAGSNGINGQSRASPGFVPPPPTQASQHVAPPPNPYANLVAKSPAPSTVPVPVPNPYAAVQSIQSGAAGSPAPFNGSGPVGPPPVSRPATVASPVNPYAPQASANDPTNGLSNSYAPPPGARQPNSSTAPYTGAPAPPPPTVAASSVASPPPASNAAAVSSSTNSTSASSAAAAPPAAAPKYPPGDRSHISDDAKPIYEILSAEIARVKPLIPANFKKQVIDCEKRLNILFDHLNNDDLLSPDTVADMTALSQAIVNKDYDTAHQIRENILLSRSDECGQWMVGVKRLVEMSRAV